MRVQKSPNQKYMININNLITSIDSESGTTIFVLGRHYTSGNIEKSVG